MKSESSLFSQESPSRMHLLSDLIELYDMNGSQHYWTDLEEVRIFATQWMYRYNHQRPHMALCGMTPMQRLAMAA
jgi:transposase InsO family protein